MALRCRKNQASLTPSERSRFVAAVLALKASGTYDQYVRDHMNAMLDAHRGAAFLPWHREFLRRFELDLQKIDAGVTLPYWNWTVDRSPLSSIWDPAFLGGNGRPSDGRVTTGPFAFGTGAWTLLFDGPALRRRFGLSASALPVAADVTGALGDAIYDVAPYNASSPSGFRNRLEGWISGPQLHNLVHVWVGGSMGPMSSPNDPVFFLHHCFIDRLWADWHRLHPGAGSLPVSGAAPGHNLGDAMQPWAGRGETITPASRLDHHALGYAYDNEPECTATLKFRDDLPPTLKFRDDRPTLKFRDDLPPTLKFRDDGGTLKAIDDVKQPVLETPRIGRPGPIDPARASSGPSFGQPAPFVLSTPHHSMAWAQEQPGVLEAAVAQSETQLTVFAAAISEREAAQQEGQLTEAEAEELQQLRQEYEALLAEYQQLVHAGRTA